jgi:hypothetical protein
MNRPFVAQVDVALDREAVRVFVGEHGGPRRLGLADDALRARLVEEDVVDAAGPPGVDALGAAHAGFADERVPAAVVVAGVIVRAVVILLL